MMRRLSWGILIIGWFIGWVWAQGSPLDERVLLFNAATGELLQVGQTSESVPIRLPYLPLSMDEMALSAPVLAYITRTENNAPLLVFWNVETAEVQRSLALSDVPLPFSPDHNDDLRLSQMAFDANGRFLAVAYRVGGMGWGLRILDREGETRHELRFGDALLVSYPTLHAGVLPHIRAVYADEQNAYAVHFSVANDSARALNAHRSYVWYPMAQSLYETLTYPSPNEATLTMTGETLHPIADSRFDVQAESYPRLPFLYPNTLQVGDANGRFVVFHSPEMPLTRAYFVQNGERVLLEAQESPISRVWLLLNREGRELYRYRRTGENVWGGADGFFVASHTQRETALRFYNTRTQASSQVLWEREGRWEIVGVAFGASDAPLVPFASQSAPLNAPSWVTIGATPTLYPTPLPLLRVGMSAYVQVPENGYLNLRSQPSTNGAVLALIESGTRVELIGDSVLSEGFLWWQVRVGGREGWLIESLPDVQTLVPSPLMPLPSPTPPN